MKKKSKFRPRTLCELREECGAFIRRATREECDRLVARGDYMRVGLSTYRERRGIEPSKSDLSVPMLTGGNRFDGDGGDMQALAGMKFSDSVVPATQLERFMGWGLLRTA